ncbi:B-cell receptor CD22-like isoform X2 [Gadus chalcogrammus]|uniref:B-cell receptor CD22-like isoform X1 n=1 Tax=Gadus chalcogrammus TaxID=1042646 RepID=UPI0024C49C8E|nr:B-cell receptor CD22-like isoform X1 [Gadus chalcogrammus]XP_056457371.1 B-cell receptor CD22-like isoform X2 [Gadus chalcogrammus]
MTRTILGILLIIQGVWSRDLAVEYQSQCAFKGTSVTIPCSYSHPPGNKVTSVTWYRGEPRTGGWTGYPFFTSSSMNGFQYLGDTSGSCTLRIKKLLDSDQAGYFVILRTEDKKFTAPDITLTVQDPGITAVVPTVVVERDMVTLICKTECIGYPPANMVVWSRDGKAVASPTFQAGLDDAGSYQCAWEGLLSNTVTLDVQFLPRNTTVWVEPQGEVLKGNSVNLTCSSAANPPVHNYTWWWYSGTAPPPASSMLVPIGMGQVLYLASLVTSQTGYYLCQATNTLGESNSSALLQIEGTTLGRESVLILSGVGVTVFVALTVLVCLWSRKQQKTKENQHSVATSSPSGRSLTSSTNPDPDSMYANVHVSSLPSRSLTPPQVLYDVHTHDSAQGGEIAYSILGNFGGTRPVNPGDPKQQPFQPTEAGDAAGHSVIYSSVAEAT